VTSRIGLIGAVRGSPDPAPELAQLLPPGTSLVAYPSRVAAFPYTPLEQALQQIGHADAAFAAAAAGCDAVVIDSVGDYGLAAIRAALNIPAIGAGEAGLAAAAADCRRFAIVTVWPASMNFIYEGLLAAYGHAQACTGLFNVGAEDALDDVSGPDGYLARVYRGENRILGAIGHAIARACSGGAEAVLLGCTCMSALADRLTDSAPVPVINPLRAGVLAALAAAPAHAPPARTAHQALVTAMVDAVAAVPSEPCPVCITGSAP
jgi:allantoin racemase